MAVLAALVVALAGATGTSKYRLRYFDARGAAELARVILAVADVPYADDRYPLSFEGGKPSAPRFYEEKAAGALAANMDRVPLLEVDGTAIAQSRAIERYLARAHGLLGATELEAAQIDAVCEHCRDIKDGYGRAVPPFSAESEEKAKKRDEWYGETLPSWCSRLERALPPPAPAAAAAHAVGASVSHADLAIWQLLKDYFSEAERCAAALQGCERLSAIAEAVHALPAVQDWLARRPQTFM